jgi:hypothetical protein
VKRHADGARAVPLAGILDGRAVVNPHANLAALKPQQQVFLFLAFPHALNGINGVQQKCPIDLNPDLGVICHGLLWGVKLKIIVVEGQPAA